MSTLELRGTLAGHENWVTSIATSSESPDTVVSASRDKSVMIWKLHDGGEEPGHAVRSLRGHEQTVADVQMSTDGKYVLSASWDKTMRIWDVEHGQSQRILKGHTSDVFSCAFSIDNRQIVSGSRDKTIRVWNTLAENKYTITEDCHSNWVSCVRFSPSVKQPIVVSSGWDSKVKVWNIAEYKLKNDLESHTAPVYTVTISPDGSLCASGGKDGTATLWDINEGSPLYSLDGQSPINSLTFSPKHYWLSAATDKSIKIWDLQNKAVLDEVDAPSTAATSGIPWCTSLTWSHDGNTLFAGSTDGNIYVYGVRG